MTFNSIQAGVENYIKAEFDKVYAQCINQNLSDIREHIMSNSKNSPPQYNYFHKFNLFTYPQAAQEFLNAPTTKESRSFQHTTLELQAAYAIFAKHAPPHKVTSTARTWKKQAEYYAQGRTAPGDIVTRAMPGQSYHNYGVAFDCYPLDNKGNIVWSRDMKFWLPLESAAREAGLEWAGRWKSFQEFPHFQLKNLPTLK